MGTFLAKADLHLHSKASNLPGGWFSKLINCPESYAEPVEIYKRLKEREMTFVAITDHNTINGVLEIAHLPDVFISCEYTVEFPEEGAKVHVLVYGLEEKHHQDLIKLRDNIYEFVSYLKKENLPHSLAHPLYSVQGTKLNRRIVDKLGLLFDNWEIINGTRGDGVREIEEKIAKLYNGWNKIRELEERYGIKAMRSREYISFTAGSDDHGGMDVGRTWTGVEGAKTKEDFLRGLLEGRTSVGSESLGEERLINMVTRVGYGYVKSKYQLPESVKGVLDYLFMYSDNPMIGMAIRYFTGINGDRTRLIKSLMENLPLFAYKKFSQSKSLTDLGMLALSIPLSLFPLFIKHAQRNEERKIEELAAKEFGIKKQREPKVAYFTDTYWEINGVARTAQIMRKIAQEEGLPFHFFISSKEAYAEKNLTSLRARLVVPTPFYEELKLNIPSMAELIEVLEKEGFTHVHVSTPGPLGIMAFVAAKVLGLKVSFAYHTDIPKYAYVYTKDETLEKLLLKLFVGVAKLSDKFFVPSEYYRKMFVAKGVEPQKVRIFRRGVDTETFSPEKRVEDFWSKKLGKRVKRVILFVGRVAKEKNLDTFVYVATCFPEETFVVVGDGHYREELERKKPKNVHLVGYMRGEELAQAYASSYVFLFPSETETYAQVVLEAMASGLPVIVSSKGASREHVKDYANGFIATTKEDYVRKLSLILSDENLRNSMSVEARKYALSLDMRKTYLEYLYSIMGSERLACEVA